MTKDDSASQTLPSIYAKYRIISHFSDQKGIRTQLRRFRCVCLQVNVKCGFVNIILPYLNYWYTAKIVRSPVKKHSKHIQKKEY